MESKAITPFYLDKALWVVVFTPLVAIAARKFGLDLNAEELVGIILPAVVYAVTHKWKSGAIAVAEIKAAAAQAPVVTTPAATPADALKDAAK